MKRLSTIIMALALVLGMSQCKKQETPTNGNGGEKVHITLNVDNSESLAVNVNDNGSRHDMSPRLGMVKFENGDVLHVGYNGHYFGQLTYQNGAFGGDLDAPAQNVEDNLHFYFLGGKGKGSEGPSANATSFTFSIADQHDVLPVLCYGASSQKYKTTTTNYSAVLEYKCALVRFDLENDVYDDVTLSNVLTEATINFANNAITPTTTKGDITLYGEDGVVTHRWGILLKGTDLTSGHDDLDITGYQGQDNLANLDNNNYIDGGISISNPRPVALPNADLVIKNSSDDFSVFTVSSTGKKVYFSKANLTWNSTAGYHFHATQFDEEHIGGSSAPNYGSYPTNGDVNQSGLTGLDRFTWGHIPNQSINSSYYLTNNQMAMHGLNPEWGKQMMGEGNDQWRTLTADEWNYLLHERSGNRFLLATVLVPNKDANNNDYFVECQGLLLFPDGFNYSGLNLTTQSNPNTGIVTGFYPDWINTVFALNPTANDHYVAIYDNIVNGNQTNWIRGPYKLIEANEKTQSDGKYLVYTNPNSNMYKLLAAGCVFLPGVGCRQGAQYRKYNYYTNRNNAAQGFYWTADPLTVGTDEKARYFWFGYIGGNNVETDPVPTFDADNTQSRDLGCCVRLVWDAN